MQRRGAVQNPKFANEDRFEDRYAPSLQKGDHHWSRVPVLPPPVMENWT